MRAWARMLVRDNAYAWGVVDTIVSSVVGENGIVTMSATGDDGLDERRDQLWKAWCQVADINGELDWVEIQRLAVREMVEAGECLIHFRSVPLVHNGIRRPIPLAVELIDADRFATERDTLRQRKDGIKIERGIEYDAEGRVLAYHVHKDHPSEQWRMEIERLPAANVQHLYRKDRIGQGRGVSWFAPVVTWLRDLGVYLENEMVASAVSACYTAAVKTTSPMDPLATATGEDTSDSDGNRYEFMQPGMIMHLMPDEDIEFGQPGRPNASAGPWINLILRGIAVGTGLSFETVSRDYSQTNYSSNRASQLEDRRRFRAWQRMVKNDLTNPAWMRFAEAATMVPGSPFPDLATLLEEGMQAVPIDCLATGWEWVDPTKEQAASAASIESNLSTLRDELGARGKHWREVLRQRAIETEVMTGQGITFTTDETAVAAEAENEPDGATVDDVSAEGEEPGSDNPLIDPSVDAGVATDLTLSGVQITAAITVLEKLVEDTLAKEAAIELLVAVGLPREEVETMVTAQESVDPPEPEPMPGMPLPPGQPGEEQPETVPPNEEPEDDGDEDEEA